MESRGQHQTSDEVAAEIQRERKRRGWSYRQLAEELGNIGMKVSEPVLINVLTRRAQEAHGKQLPARALTVDELLACAQVFNTSAIHLIPRADPVTNSFELRFTSEAAFTYFGQHYEELAVLMERKANQEGA
jgi:hypothetical protein